MDDRSTSGHDAGSLTPSSLSPMRTPGSDRTPKQATGAPPLKVLILEDAATDAELMERELKKAGIAFVAKRVETRAAFAEALETFQPDVVLCDYTLPDFTGADALATVRRTHPHIPVVMVTGTLGDERAIELLKAGAKDYVLKNNLVRLPSSVERAISVEMGIRARKDAERALRRSFTLLEAVGRIANIGGWEWNMRDNTLIWSDEVYRQHGRSRAEWMPTVAGFLAQIHRDDRQRVTDAIAACTQRHEPFDLDMRIVRPDGSERTLHSTGELMVDNAGNVFGLTGTSHDITERKRAEEALRASEQRFRLLVEEAPDAILLYDFDQNRFIDANKMAERLFGCSRDEIIRYGPQHFYTPVQPDRRPVPESFDEHNQRALGGEQLTYERRILNRMGQERLCEVTLVRLPSAAQRLLRVSYVDVTERREAARTLERLNRALSTLSRGNEVVVHAKSEAELIAAMCRTIVETGGYRMAWFGTVAHDERKSITPVGWAGDVRDFLEKLPNSWSDGHLNISPCGRAVNTGQPRVIQNFATDPALAQLYEVVQQYGFASCAALPLKRESGVFATLSIYAGEPDAFGADALAILQELADDMAYGILALSEKANTAKAEERWRNSLEATIGALANTVEMRDEYTAGHQQRVAQLAVAIARDLKLPDQQIEGLYLAGIIHDVGKINIPAEILSKPGKLTHLQFQLIQAHAELGHDIVKGIEFPWPIAEMVFQHHERLDGSGYPRSLTADAILPEAKILAVADVVEAMMSHRPYRPALGLDAALAEIEGGKGSRYDTSSVEACTALFRDKGFSFTKKL